MGVADNERDAGENGEFFRSALGVAACDENPGRGILEMNFANGVAGLCVGGGCDGAGVDDDEFGVLWGGGWRAAAVTELALDRGTVGLGGAAAELFDVEGRHFR